MEVDFTAGQEAQLAKIASRSGTNPESLVKDAALRLLQEEAVSAPPCVKASLRPTVVSH